MNDEFLYDLRRRPSTEFALRLKSKLDRQQAQARERRRSFAWFIAGGLLVGSSALAFVSPVIRDMGRTLIVRLRGDEQTASSATISVRPRTDSVSRREVVRSRPDSHGPIDESAQIGPEKQELTLPPVTDPPTSAPASRPQVAIAPNGLARTTLQIAYEAQFADLIGELATSVERRNMSVSVQLSEWPRNADICDNSFRAANTHVVISDFRFLQGDRTSCNGFVEVPFAYRAVAVVVNPESTWLRNLTIDDLRKLREGDTTGQILAWSQLRNEWPTVTPIVFGGSPATTELGRRVVNTLEWRRTPSMYRATEDDQSTMAQVERTFGAIGFVDFDSWRAERNTLLLAQIASANAELVQPTISTIQSGDYPLRKTVWMYFRIDRPLRWDMWQAIEGLPKWQAVPEAGLIPIGRKELQELSGIVGRTSGMLR